MKANRLLFALGLITLTIGLIGLTVESGVLNPQSTNKGTTGTTKTTTCNGEGGFSVEGVFFSTKSTEGYALIYVRNLSSQCPITISSVYLNQTLYEVNFQIPANNVTAIDGPNGICMSCAGQPIAGHGDIQTVTVKGLTSGSTTMWVS
jgi:hypothetical protein